jgi:dTDP-glucose 4,6-dehydratase
MRLIVTGGFGFIGANFIRYWLNKYPSDVVVNVDSLTYAAVESSLEDIKEDGRYFFEKADIVDYCAIEQIVKKHEIDTIINFAAESHNSLSIINPTEFYRTNLLGAQTLMEITRKNPQITRLHHVSTCEIFGDMSLDCEVGFDENYPLGGNSPYNSSKACSNLAANAYFKTFGIPITVSTCSNNYGPYQFPEKLIPLFATNLLQDKQLTLYEESENKREWLHVIDHCQAIETILFNGKLGELYNIGSGDERSIEEIARIILDYYNMPDSYKTYIKSRPSHDRRYLLDSTKIKKELNWTPSISFEQGMKSTLEWYANNENWWLPLVQKKIVVEGNWENANNPSAGKA